MQTRQKLFIAGSLVVIGLGVLTFVFILMSSLNASPSSPAGQKSSPGATTTATHHAPATPAITPLHPDPQAGWVKAPAIADAKAIAFSLSAPLTGYVCTNSTHVTDIYKATSSPLFIRATHDGGRTWSAPLSTGISTISCKLTINPDNPNDVIFNRIDCLFCDALIGSPYRSLDGGKTWAQVNLPSGPSQNGHITQFAFDGTTMYVTVDYYPGDYKSNPQLPLVAVSVNGQPLQWTNTTALPPGVVFWAST